MKELKEKIKPLEKEHKQEIKNILNEFNKSLSYLHDAATIDEKTGLYNHRFFKSLFEIEIERAKKEPQELSLIIIDIDFFKKVNDTYGHLTGDLILKELAKHLKKKIRKYDVLARFGGEEFLILIPGYGIEQSIKIAERLRKSLTQNKILKKYKITISLGVTEYKKRDNMEKMVKRADKALYKSKENGRNQANFN